MTSSETSLLVLDQIRNALLTIAGNARTGAQLRSLIDRACPGFDVRAAAGVPTGPGALTKFLNTHFQDIVHAIGKHGGDILYSIGASGLGADAGVKALGGRGGETNLWAVFASPGLRQQLVIDRITGRSFSQPLGTPISEDETAIPPISRDEFRTIAERFIDNVPTSVQEDLRQILAQPDFVYQNWISTLRESFPSYHHRWGLHRVKEIIDLFRQRLADAGVAQDQLEATVNRLVEAQSATYKERLFIRTRSALYDGGSAILDRQEVRPPLKPSMPPVAESGTPTDPRSLAILAISHMSTTEIRQLAIPLGAVIDAGLLSQK